MKNKLFGIYGKVFSYTLLVLVLALVVVFLFFSNQLKGVEYTVKEQQLSGIFRPLYMNLSNKSEDEVVRISEEFHARNTSFEFRLEAPDGRTIYQTDKFKMPEIRIMGKQLGDMPDRLAVQGNGQFKAFTDNQSHNTQFISLMSNGYRLCVSNLPTEDNISDMFTRKLLFAFSIIFFICIAAAALFAGRISKPIQKIAIDAQRMSRLLDVSEPKSRNDEIGQLATHVYAMYTALKLSITQLEDEVKKEREMEENQRYFFAAASHELKTPIAAAGALIEGVLEGVVPPAEYPVCLQECLHILSAQNRLVSDILELSALNMHISPAASEKISLAETVGSVCASAKAIADEKALTVTVNIPKDMECVTNKKLLTAAFSNIILNAIQNTEKGGAVSIYTEAEADKIAVCVLNKGAKIPDALLTKLFNPFFREDMARSRGDGRTGLGLTIVKKILDLLTIDYRLSNTESGVLFRMVLSRS